MKEVSCRAFEPLDRARRNGLITEAELLVGIPYDINYLRNRHERIEWSTWCRLTDNARSRISPEEYEELGAVFTQAKAGRAFLVFARLLFQPASLMRWMQSVQNHGRSMFTCVDSVSKKLADDRIMVTLNVQEGYQDSPEFFYITKGLLRSLTELLTSGRGNLTSTISTGQAIFEFYLPHRPGPFSRVKRALLLPFNANAAADELEDAHRGLQQRYAQLEEARETLASQAQKLEAAHKIAEVIEQERGLETTIQALAASMPLVVPALESIELWVDKDTEGNALHQHVASGRSSNGESFTRALLARAQRLGGLRAWLATSHDRSRLEELIDFLLPTLCAAVENALNYDAILRYRDELERRVQERTEELSKAKDELGRSLEDLQAAEAARDRIFANLNHDLRTPLSIMRLATEEVSSSLEPSMRPLVAAPLRSIDRNVSRLLDLVNDLLFLAAHDEGKLSLTPQQIDLEELVRETTEAWGPLARENGIELRFVGTLDQDLLVDEKAMHRILSNLLSNAIKYTPCNGEITVSLRSDEVYCVLTVQDTGTGMPAEFVEKAFDRFSQGPAPIYPSLGRSGIGLSLVKELVAAHEGNVSLESIEGQGTTVRISLPLHKDRLRERVSSRVTDSMPAASGLTMLPTKVEELKQEQLSTHTILIAEDEEELRGLMERALSQYYRVLTAGTGVEALELAKSHRPDLLITDIEMPEMDGLELTQRFMKLRSNRAAPTLMVTARGDVQHRIEGLMAGAIDYIAKPFHLSELLARVQAQLKVRDLFLKLQESERLAAIGFLGAGMAHEFRNPVNMIVNAIAPLRRLLPTEVVAASSRTGSLFEVVETSAARLRELCQAILELENPDKVVVVPVSVRDLLTTAVTATIAGTNLERDRFTVHCPKDLVAPVSRTVVLQILKCLIDNAIDHAGTTAHIELYAGRRGDELVICVSDDGPGIPAEIREDVFAPFFTTAEAGSGTGLGLALAQKMAVKHGGSLKVLDTDSGCSIEFRLAILGT